MPESYREMEARHAQMDDREYQREQEDEARWAGPTEYIEVELPARAAVPDPAPVRDCTNCRYAGASREASGVGYWCRVYQRSVFADGKAGCSGWPWDPKDGVEHEPNAH